MKNFMRLIACISLPLLLAGCAADDAPVSVSSSKIFDGLVIVIDPGHGGADHGAISKSGIKEDGLNLQVSLLVKEKLKLAGAVAVMTRESADVDYSGDSKTRKRRDMENRARFIVASNPSAVVSIHMNKYTNRKYYGPQTYFGKITLEARCLPAISRISC